MAEYGEWNRKGATLSDITAQKEFGVSRDFIVRGVRAGKLEYREGSIWGNPYIRLLRSQLNLSSTLLNSTERTVCPLGRTRENRRPNKALHSTGAGGNIVHST